MQTDLKYNNQIHSIIVALSLHVVVLIKDLNGNHVIQKCLNKLAPEDNQVSHDPIALSSDYSNEKTWGTVYLQCSRGKLC